MVWLYRNEPEIEDSNILKKLSVSALAHLSSDHIQYVFRWAALLKLEDDDRKKDMVPKVSDIWCMSSENRLVKPGVVQVLLCKRIHHE